MILLYSSVAYSNAFIFAEAWLNFQYWLVIVSVVLNQGPLLGGWVGGARSALNTEIVTSLLSSEGAFSGILDSFVHENVQSINQSVRTLFADGFPLVAMLIYTNYLHT